MNLFANIENNIPPLVLLRDGELIICGKHREAHQWLKKEHMRRSSAYVLYDPCGTLLNLYGNAFLRHAYTIKTFDTTICRSGARYNPFVYIRGESDAAKLAAAIIHGTEGCAPFDDDFISAEKLLLTALICYVHGYAPLSERNFNTINEMLKSMDVSWHMEEYKTAVDLMFEAIGETDGSAAPWRLYKQFRATPYKKDQRLIESCSLRLAPLVTKQALNFMSADGLGLDRFAYDNTALFIKGSYSCSDLGFLVPLIYSQLFDLLYEEIAR
jgi:type IV secretion system protein VirD4